MGNLAFTKRTHGNLSQLDLKANEGGLRSFLCTDNLPGGHQAGVKRALRLDLTISAAFLILAATAAVQTDDLLGQDPRWQLGTIICS